MQRIDGLLIFSPSDLHSFLECQHLTALQLLASEGSIGRAQRSDSGLELLRRKGFEHEQAWLARLRGDGRRIVEIDRHAKSWTAAAAATERAMRDGVEVIYQGVFAHGAWCGVADFVVRVQRRTHLGDWGYEAWDTKLARHSKPYFILQLAFYTEAIARVQRSLPDRMHVVLGTHEAVSFNTADFDAYFRYLKVRLSTFAGDVSQTRPYPVAHCTFCDFGDCCDRWWKREDHLSLVANIRREQVARLEEAGIATVAALGALQQPPPVRIGAAALSNLMAQARLQAGARRTGRHTYELLPPEQERGFALLPPPDEGDLFFDMEGFPYFEAAAGLEYLFGVAWNEGGRRQFRAFWALNRAEEKRAFEQFIDFVRERLARYPDLHVYHYASYEDTAVKRLMGQHGTRAEELDDLLRREVFVDLHRVVRQTLRISHDSYSLKKVRTFFMPEAGQGTVTEGGESIVEFDRWMQTGDRRILDAIERYNEEDCFSTLELREWLLERKLEAERTFGASIPWRPQPDDARKPVEIEPDEHAGLKASLLSSAPAEEASARRLLVDLLGFHRRELKPAYWSYFDRREKSTEELLEDPEAIAALETVPGIAPAKEKRSLVYTLAFPPQEFKLDEDDEVEDPRTGKSAGSLIALDGTAGVLKIKRGSSFEGVPLPRNLIAGRPLRPDVQADAVAAVAVHVAASGLKEGGRFQAVRDLLLRELPRVQGRSRGASIQTTDLSELKGLVSALDGTCLFVQGPPGSGKTWTGARLIVHLLKNGQRVGVSALSHKAIHKLLEEIEVVAREERYTFQGLKKASAGRRESLFHGRAIQNTTANPDCEARSARLVAGTSWLFARPEMQESFDYLFVDEGGQISLADAVAIGTAARNLVLLGDPQQLPNVTQGVHPDGSGLSVLEHLLGERATVPEDRGVFLDHTRRMHPDVCRFISTLSYDGRLKSAEGCERQRVASNGLSGTGLRFMAVEHSGNAQMSVEEARVIGAEIRRLLDGGTFTEANGRTRPLLASDVLVVAPYNMQVRCLREHVPSGVECGTVDKFQGREAAVVFFSLASSSGDDIPRNVDFLFSRNRLNVAVSRARCLAVLVASPRLLEVRCRTADQMRLVNGVCRFVEMADEQSRARAERLVVSGTALTPAQART